MPDFYDWSTTASTNGSADSSINWNENQNPDTVNDSARALMARIAEWRKDAAPTRATTGTGNAYAVTSNAGGSGSPRDGEIVAMVIDRANTTACTLSRNGSAAKPLRPEIGREFAAGELRANQVLLAYFHSSSDSWLSVGSGYHVNAMTNGVLTQAVASSLLRIGTPTLSLAPTPNAGYIRLTETTQTLSKATWPELSAFLSGHGYPFGSTSTTFNLPPAAGYFLRFAATSGAIDTSGARAAGSTQADQNKAHIHSGSVSIAPDGNHAHGYSYAYRDGTLTSTGGAGNSYWKGDTTPSSTTAQAGTHTHSASVTIDPEGGAEGRVKNVAYHCDVYASSALAGGTLGMYGFAYLWDTGTTAADPGSGRIRADNAAFGSITTLYINETDAWGVGLSGLMAAVPSGSVIRITQVGAQGNTIIGKTTAAGTDSGAYRSFPITVLGSAGTIANNATISVEFFLAGETGATGAAGANGTNGTNGTNGDPGEDGGGILFTFDSSTTTNADPGTGDLRLNNATLSSVTEIAISYSSAHAGNPSAENFIKSWDDSTNTSHYGYLKLMKNGDPNTWALYNVTSALTDGTTYGRYTVSYVNAAGTFAAADTLSVHFTRTGNKGADGAGSGDVTAAAAFATDNRLLRSDGTGKGAQASAVTVDDSGNMSGVGTLAVGGAVSGVTTLTQSSYHDMTEISAPANPSANVARLYAFDVSTVTRMAMRDSAGVVSMLDGNHNIQAFTSSGTFTTPAHSSTRTVYRYVIVGAGGGGGGINGNGDYSSAGGGGAGGVVIGTFTGVAASTGITITVGTGGTAGASTGGNGGNGGSSSIGTPVSVTAGGGTGAAGLTPATATTPAASAGGAGGTASGGTVNIAGMKGMNGGSPGYAAATATVYAFFGGMGASGPFGGGGTGGGGYVAGNGSNATGYGAGGGGGVTKTTTGGTGSDGLVIIEWVL